MLQAGIQVDRFACFLAGVVPEVNEKIMLVMFAAQLSGLVREKERTEGDGHFKKDRLESGMAGNDVLGVRLGVPD